MCFLQNFLYYAINIFTELDQRNEMIIFNPSFTTFEASYFFDAAGAAPKIGSSLKSIHHRQI
jgi:hypothetical protein